MAQKILYSILVGILAGLSSTVFLYSLDWVTHLRLENQWLIWGLPFAGLLIGLLYHYLGQEVVAGNNLVIHEIHDPRKKIPFRMAPFIYLGTILTHLFGGSAGREGTAVQMGASLSDQVAKFFDLTPTERKGLLMSGAGAGFGAAIGAPWAGVIFGMEIVWTGRLRFISFVQCLLASWSAYHISKLFHAPHSVYSDFEIHSFSFKEIFYVSLAGIIFGMAVRFFIMSTHIYEKFLSHFIKYPPLRTFIGGFIVVILFWLEGSYQFAGLGIEVIQQSLIGPMSFTTPILKSIFTSLTLGAGFKGGEFIPLVFVGASLGSALSTVLPVGFNLLSSVGFSAVFAAASKTPIACTVMSIEIFGWEIAPYAFIGCIVANFVSGKQGIYLAQRL